MLATLWQLDAARIPPDRHDRTVQHPERARHMNSLRPDCGMTLPQPQKQLNSEAGPTGYPAMVRWPGTSSRPQRLPPTPPLRSAPLRTCACTPLFGPRRRKPATSAAQCLGWVTPLTPWAARPSTSRCTLRTTATNHRSDSLRPATARHSPPGLDSLYFPDALATLLSPNRPCAYDTWQFSVVHSRAAHHAAAHGHRPARSGLHPRLTRL